MLDIRLNGQSVDLPDNISLSITAENMYLWEDSIQMAFSFPVELARSSRNLRILGYPERVTSAVVSDEVPCEVYFDSLLIASGSFTFEIGETISGYFKGAESNQNFDTPLNELDLQFDDEGRKFSNDYCMAANSYNDKPVVFAPIKLFGEIETEGSLVNWKNYLNNYLAGGQFTRDMFPAVRVGYLLDKIIGPTLTENPFRGGALYNVVLQTLQHKGWKYPQPVKYNALEEYLPKMTSSEFLLDVLKTFGATMVVEDNKYRIAFRKDLFDSEDKVDITDRVLGRPTIIREKGRGYVYGYSGEKRYDGSFKEYDSTEKILRIDNPVDLIGLEAQGDEQYLWVENINQIVHRVFNYTEESKWKYEIINSGFGYAEQTKTDNFDTSVSLKTLDMTPNWILQYSDSENKSQIYCPQVELSDLSSDKAVLMLWQRDIFLGDNFFYPYLSAYNFNGFSPDPGQLISPFSLRWEGATGLIETFHRPFVDWMAKDKMIYKCSMLWNAVYLSTLSWLRKYYIAGRYFFLKKYTIQIERHRIHPAQLEFISA